MSECDCGPWIKLSMCGAGAKDADGTLYAVVCPSRYCATLAPLVDGKISEHDGLVPGPCPFLGVRVVDDTADFLPEPPTQGQRP